MRVPTPINPQTNVDQGQLGYARAADVSSGWRTIANAVGEFAKYRAEQDQRREMFDVNKAILDEANTSQNDYEQRVQNATAETWPTFVPQLATDYTARNKATVEGFKAKGYSEAATNALELGLQDQTQSYTVKAMAATEHFNTVKATADVGDMADGASRYAYNNPTHVQSALAQGDSIDHLPIDAAQKLVLKDKFRQQVLNSAAEGYGNSNPLAVVTKLAPWAVPHPDGTPNTNVPLVKGKPSGQLSSSIVDGLQARGLTEPQARGVAAGIFAESSNNPGAVNPTSGASYLGQWLGPRLDAIHAKYDRNPTLSQQLDFLVSELKGGDKGGPSVLAQGNEADVFRHYITDFMRPSDSGAQTDFKNGLAALGYSQASAPAPATLKPIPPGWKGNQEDAIQELGMTADQAATFLKTGKDTRVAPPTTQSTATDDPYAAFPITDPSRYLGKAKREDGTDKGLGFLGPRMRPDGNISSEISIGVEMDGKEVQIPTMVPGLTSDEMNYLMTNDPSSQAFIDNMPQSIKDKAVANAQDRIAQGKSPFLQAGETGDPVLDAMNGQQQQRALEVARTTLNQQTAEQERATREQHSSFINGVYNQLADGSIGQTELNAMLADGRIVNYDERSKAQNIIDEKNKGQASLDLFHQMWRSGGKFNPFDPNAQKAVDEGFKKDVFAKNGQQIDPFNTTLEIWHRTGIIPTQGGIYIRGALVSTDPKQVELAASVANNMIRENPNAFAGVTGQTDIEHSAVAYGHYIYDFGMTPQEAATKVAQENDPKVKEKFKYNDPATQAAVLTLRQNGVNATQVFHAATFPNQDALNEANQTYYEEIRNELNRGTDLPGAMAQAKAQMQKVYGVNRNNRIVKYPPERAYPQVNGSWDYIYQDAQKTVKDETGRDPIHINLTPIPGVTDQDFRAGNPARYRIVYTYDANGQTVVDSVPGEFAADVTGAQQVASAGYQKQFVGKRGEVVKTQQKVNQALGSFGGAGGPGNR